MMSGQQLIEAIHVLGRDGLDHQMNENLLFIDRGPAKPVSCSSFHPGSIKSCNRVVPQNLSLRFWVTLYSCPKTRPTSGQEYKRRPFPKAGASLLELLKC